MGTVLGKGPDQMSFGSLSFSKNNVFGTKFHFFDQQIGLKKWNLERARSFTLLEKEPTRFWKYRCFGR